MIFDQVGINRESHNRDVNEYPAFIVEGRDKYMGWEKEELECLIDRHL